MSCLDAATGAVLLDTLVNPGCPVSPGVYWVHGISDEQLVGAPPLAEVWPQLLGITRDRTVLAYNAEFDADTPAASRSSGRAGPSPPGRPAALVMPDEPAN